MYERSPQKSPQLRILNLLSRVLTDHPDTLVCVPKSVCRFLNRLAAVLETLATIRSDSSSHYERNGNGSEGNRFSAGLTKSACPEGKSQAVALTLLWAGPRMAAVNTSMVT